MPENGGCEFSGDSSNESGGGSGDCGRCSEEREVVRERSNGDGDVKLDQGDEVKSLEFSVEFSHTKNVLKRVMCICIYMCIFESEDDPDV